jgi:cathepsin L
MEFRENRHRTAFEENLAEIQKHNQLFEKGVYSFKLSPNSFADLSNTQYLKRYVRLIHNKIDEIDQDYIVGSSAFSDKSYPEALDWRAMGFQTPPCNQKSCGSCYAFSIAHSIEGQLFKRLRQIIPLSVQQIVDCSVNTGNHGCGGGSLKTTLRYLEGSGGLMRESDYPYTASLS